MLHLSWCLLDIGSTHEMSTATFDGMGGEVMYITEGTGTFQLAFVPKYLKSEQSLKVTVIVIIWNDFQESRSTDLGCHIIFILFSCILWYRWRANVWKIRKSLCKTTSRWRRSCLGRTTPNRQGSSNCCPSVLGLLARFEFRWTLWTGNVSLGTFFCG